MQGVSQMSIIAKTEPRESYTGNGIWHREYKLCQMNTITFDRLRSEGRIHRLEPYRDWAIYTRRVDAARAGDWELWQLGHTPEEVIRESCGDTAFLEATSYDYRHAEAVKATQAARAASYAVNDAKSRLIAAIAAHSDYARDCDAAFSKATRHITDEATFEKRRAAWLKRRGPHMEKLRAEIEEAKKHLADVRRMYNVSEE